MNTKLDNKVGPAVMINDFDPSNLHLDKLTENNTVASPETTHDFTSNHGGGESETEMKSPVRLAAQSLISHFINHLFHFPMETGASSLNSMVNEQDDNPRLKSVEELSLEALQSPNVQLFILNDFSSDIHW